MKASHQHIEACALACALLDETAAAAFALMEAATPDDFGHPAHRAVFEAVRLTVQQRQAPTVPMVGRALDTMGQLARVGGLDGLLRLLEMVPSAANVGHYAGLVRDHARLRRLAAEAREIAAQAEDAVDAAEYIAQAQGKLLGFTEQASAGAEEASTWSGEEYTADERRAAEGVGPVLETGLWALDDLGVARRGSLIIIGGRPAMGKTSFSCEASMRLALRRRRVAFFSFEMTRPQLVTKWVAGETNIPTARLEVPSWLSPAEWEAKAKAHRAFAELELPVWCPERAPSFAQVYVRARRLHMVKPLDALVIDYLQLIRGDDTGRRNRDEVVGEIALGCKSLAKELNIPVFVLSQLSRSVDARDPPIPLLSDLRESGNIEAHADSVLFPFRPSAYDADADPEKATLFCAKARFGRPGHRAMRFLEGTQRFTDE